MSQKLIDTLMRLADLKFSDKKDVIINSKFRCKFIKKNSQCDDVFQPEEQDINSPRVSRKAYFEAYDYEKFSKRAGMLVISYNPDLNSSSYSASICLGQKKAKKVTYKIVKDLDDNCEWKQSMTVTSVDISQERMSFKKFMNLIHYNPKYEVTEPQDSCGLAHAQFDGLDKQEGSIEFSADGFIYYEALNFNGYHEGAIISKSMRYDVIKSTFLTEHNAKSIASKINRSLDKIFNGKAIR